MFSCITDIQIQDTHYGYCHHKQMSKFSNELQILISRTYIISSRDSVCILQL